MPMTIAEEQDVLSEHARACAASYLGGRIPDVAVTYAETRVRPASRLYRFHMAWHGRTLPVMVKVALRRDPGTAGSGRPRLVLPAPAAEKATMEFRTLAAIAEAFRDMCDSRLAWVQPLGHIEAMNAVVMLEQPADDLRRLIIRGFLGRRRPRAAALDALERAGVWLRAFGQVSLPHARDRLASSRELAEALARIGSYLDAAVRLPGGTRDIFAVAGERAARLRVPGRLALAHGDVAPRNVLRRADGRVVLIDTLGRWRTSPLEDLAYGRLALTASPSVLLFAPSRLLAWPRRCEEALLRGYFGSDPIPWRELAIYDLLVLGDRWASTVERRPRQRLPKPSATAVDRAYLARAQACSRISER